MRSILSFSDEDYIGWKPNKTFHMVIMAMIANHDSSRVIVTKATLVTSFRLWIATEGFNIVF
jgi:hypothetical protein